MSETKSEAARINGAKSRGPVTPEGKRRSSLNALTHGLTARTMVVAGEDAGQLRALRKAFTQRFQPQDRFEASLVDQIVAAQFRLERAWLIEAALIDLEITREREEVDKDFEEIDDGTRLAIAFRTLSDRSSALSLLNQYEGRLRRTFDRSLRTFRECRLKPLPAFSEKTNPTSS